MSDPVKLIEPRTLKGFRDYLPELMIPREWMLEQARRVYRSYGFAPIDTPALEYAEILLGKGGAESDKLIYRFRDHGDRDVALRFDLTVPFARFAAQHIGQLALISLLALNGLRVSEATGANIEALGLEKFRICINHRLLLNGVLEQFGMTEKAGPILHVLDKLPKIKRDATRQEMMAHAGVTLEQADKVLDLAETPGTNTEKLDRLDKNFGANTHSAEGIKRLRQMLDVTAKAGVPEERILIDLSICRGLDYYTGTVYETFLTDLPDFGSVCSGGRYDNLAGLYTKQHLPGVGASLGLDRLLAALEELKLLKTTTTPAPVFIVQFAADRIGDYQRMARTLRAAGIGAEVFPDAKKIGPQLQYAEKRGFKLGLIAGPDDFAKGTWNIKDLAKRAEKKGVPDAEVLGVARALLGI